MCIWLKVNVDRYPGGVVADVPTVSRNYCIEAAGRNDGTWSLVDLHDQTEGADPLSLLRALLAGQSI